MSLDKRWCWKRLEVSHRTFCGMYWSDSLYCTSYGMV